MTFNTKIENYVIITSLKSETMGKLINRIPGSRLLISSLRGSTLIAHQASRCQHAFSKPCLVMLRLHYVPGDHGSHDFGHRGRNGVTVTQRRGTGSTNVAHRGCRDRRGQILNSQNICHGSHGRNDLLKCAVVEWGERNKT